MQYRHEIFWEAKNAEEVRNTPMKAADPLEKWKDVENWQRKLSNKYNAREFAHKHGCKVPELYWKGRNCRQIDFSKLPAHYVIRPTIGHSCNCVFLMDNTMNLMDHRNYTPEEIVSFLEKVVQENPLIEFLVEEFIRTEEGEYRIPNDYKFYMFNGQLAFVQVINRMSSHEGFTSFYDPKWEQLRNINTIYGEAAHQDRPECYDEMYACAVKLSKSYEIFVRIDFYATDKGAVFGEFTPTPGLGAAFTPFGDKLLMSYWDNYCTDLI
ncbi:ATP-grasp fold amidoligase family protein [Pontibacter chitinilyticus]|uniref:ATP-grasp fold amidoligase family protein n=1 Tax=Pontibacter chitinilyticus TaxID=2674989 RepID=UPI00321BB0C0